MQYHPELTQEILQRLCCPACRSKLKEENDCLSCTSSHCHASFPVIGGIPVLINESNSLFSISDYTSRRHNINPRPSKLQQFVKNLLPTTQKHLKIKANLSQFVELLLKESPNPKILVIGGSTVGQGLKNILSQSALQFVESDVSFGPRTSLICDAHDIPFDDETFDGAITQVTLEHVIDPHRCVEEIHRVLKKNGILYADVPFLQQVHGGRYDFTRFTHLGYRRLFRNFDEICSGVAEGPAMTLAWAHLYFWLSFTQSKFVRNAIKVFVRLTTWWLKYIDYYLINKPGGFDAALVYYFMCRKSSKIISDREIIKEYRGVKEYWLE